LLLDFGLFRGRLPQILRLLLELKRARPSPTMGLYPALLMALSVAACGGASGSDLFGHQGGASGAPVSTGGVVSTGGTHSGGSAGVGASATGGSATGGTGGSETTGGSGTSGGTASGGMASGGSAGRAGTGGRASGGASGSVDTSKTCEQLLAGLSSLLSAAQQCNSDLDSECAGFTLNECGCRVAVNQPDSKAGQSYTSAVNTLLAQCGVACGTTCPNPTGAECVTMGSGSAGRCLGR
jgi:hypothetical protein